MQTVGPVVYRQRVGGTIEREVSARDTIRVATDDRAKVRRAREVPGEVVVAEDDV